MKKIIVEIFLGGDPKNCNKTKDLGNKRDSKKTFAIPTRKKKHTQQQKSSMVEKHIRAVECVCVCVCVSVCTYCAHNDKWMNVSQSMQSVDHLVLNETLTKLETTHKTR